MPIAYGERISVSSNSLQRIIFLFRTNLFVFAILDTSLKDTLNDSLQSLIYLLRGFGRFVGPLLYITVDCLCYERRQK